MAYLRAVRNPAYWRKIGIAAVFAQLPSILAAHTGNLDTKTDNGGPAYFAGAR